jgi:hypothetical protein
MTTGEVILAKEVMNLAVGLCCWVRLRRGEMDEEGMILGSEAGFMILANIGQAEQSCGVCVSGGEATGGVEKKKFGGQTDEDRGRGKIQVHPGPASHIKQKSAQSHRSKRQDANYSGKGTTRHPSGEWSHLDISCIYLFSK